MQQLTKFLEMIRFSHTLFALPFALFSATMAWFFKEAFSWLELVGILACMVFARSAAMAFNRLVDRDVDAQNPRTATRHLPSGQLSVASVWAFTLACSLGFIASTTIFLAAVPSNPWPILLSVPVLLILLAYSWTKRFTALAHYWLGFSLLLAPVAAWIAILGLDQLWLPGMIGLAVFFWVGGFDIIYACQDADFDRKAKLHSIPATVGVPWALRIAWLSHLSMMIVLLFLYAWASPPLGYVFLIALGGVAVLLMYEHSLVTPNDLSKVNQAFFNVNALISLGLFFVLLADMAVFHFWSGR